MHAITPFFIPVGYNSDFGNKIDPAIKHHRLSFGFSYQYHACATSFLTFPKALLKKHWFIRAAEKLPLRSPLLTQQNNEIQ